MSDTAVPKSRRLPWLAAIALLLALAGCASTPSQESMGEYIDDSMITTKVMTAVFNEPSLRLMQINVETFKGTVQLSGFVKSPDDIVTAEQAASRVKGVKVVRNDLLVR